MVEQRPGGNGRYRDLGRWYIDRFVEEVASGLPPGSTVLDAGAGEGRYRHLFSHCRFVTVDLTVGDPAWDYSSLDHVAPLHDMPFPDGHFDAVLCTQVLEHVELPRQSVIEMHRVLRPGGRLYLTVPMAQSEHQAPHDHFRYTSYGIKMLCRAAGFRSIDVEPFGGLFSRWAYELPEALDCLPVTGLRSGRPDPAGIALSPVRLVARGIVRSLQAACLELDRFDRRRTHPLGWSCVATKACPSAPAGPTDSWAEPPPSRPAG
jgi:SAM-dependent methyltransferase